MHASAIFFLFAELCPRTMTTVQSHRRTLGAPPGGSPALGTPSPRPLKPMQIASPSGLGHSLIQPQCSAIVHSTISPIVTHRHTGTSERCPGEPLEQEQHPNECQVAMQCFGQTCKLPCVLPADFPVGLVKGSLDASWRSWRRQTTGA